MNKSFFAGESEIVAVKDASIDVLRSEFLMLVGPSGCGKTTLISIMAGILHYDSGGCEVLGRDYQGMSNTEILDFRAKHIGFIFQQYNLLPSLTVAENVSIPLVIGGVSRFDAILRAKTILGELGLEGREDHMPSQLSGGQQQRVAIARALVHEPALLVCDEPTSALDHEAGQRIIEIMRKLQRKSGTSFVIVTHDNRIFQYADRIAYMDDGRIVRIETHSANEMEKQHG